MLVKGVIRLSVVVLVIFFSLEISCRVYDKVRKGIPLNYSVAKFRDPVLGWSGKKVFGDPATKKYKIFVVGDSMTEGRGIPERSMYYAYVGKKLNAELFVYGGGGYGTLQEYLVLDRYLDEIKPDLVILQTTCNDFVNNSWELERRSYLNNNLAVRPYLINGVVQYRFPRVGGKARLFLTDHSRVFQTAFTGMERRLSDWATRGWWPTAEQDIERLGKQDPLFSDAVGITEELFRRAKARCRDVPLVLFLTYSPKRVYNDQLLEIAARMGLPVTGDVSEESLGIDPQSVGLRPDRSHWGEKEHQTYGESLADQLWTLGFRGKSSF